MLCYELFVAPIISEEGTRKEGETLSGVRVKRILIKKANS
jgi:hypothetical protein